MTLKELNPPRPTSLPVKSPVSSTPRKYQGPQGGSLSSFLPNGVEPSERRVLPPVAQLSGTRWEWEAQYLCDPNSFSRGVRGGEPLEDGAGILAKSFYPQPNPAGGKSPPPPVQGRFSE